MIYIVQNLLPILFATLAGLGVGWGYYRAGGQAGWRLQHLVVAFIAEFWLAAILAGALILAPPKADPWVMGLGSAVVIWIGFVVPALVVTLRHRGMQAGSVAQDCGYWLVVMVVQAVVLHGVGLTAPVTAPV